MRRRSVPVLLLIVFVLIAAACGQKADVASVSTGGDGFGEAGGGGGFDDLGGGAADDLGGSGGDAGDGTGADPTADAGGGEDPAAAGGGGSTGGGGTDPAAGGSADQAGGGSDGPAPAGDRTGITDKEIVIGIHAPVTGAAPIPQTAFDVGKDVYWKHINEKGGLFGRNVRVVFEDDQFDPRTAVAKCKKMVTEDKVFMLIGGGGADQITACAQYANSVGVPYLSAGVNEDGLVGVRAYFAISESYAQQSPQLVQMTKKRFAGKKFGIAVADSGSFNDAFASINKAAKDGGLDVVYSERIPKNASQNQALAIAANMSSSGAEVMYFLSSPTTFLNIAAATAGQNYRPQWIGPGLTSGLNTVANIGCRAANSVDKAIFFSPFPQLDVIDKLDPEFRPAYRKHAGQAPDDLGLALWGLNKTVHQMFLASGETVSRQSFVQTLEGGAAFKTNVYPSLQYSANNHLGANTVHVLQADCASGTYKTIGQFVLRVLMLLAITGNDVTQSLVIGIVNGAVYALIALGLVLVYRSSGIFNFAQAEFGTIAVYGAYYVFTFGMPVTGWKLGYVPAAIFGVACGVAASLLTERFVIRPLSDSPKVTLLVATAGVALLSIGTAFWRTGDNALKFFDPLTQWTGVNVGNVQVSGQRILTLVLLAVAVGLLTLFFRSPYGLAVLAASQDADASALVGLDVKRISMMVWGIAGLLGATAGILLQGGNSFTPGAITSLALIPGFTAAVIGGLTSLPGAVAGGMTIGLLEAFGRLSTFDAIPGASAVSVFVVLLLVLLVRPEGLLGGRAAT